MTLTDHYVVATLAHVPAKQRADVETDLRAAIADAIDARLASGDAKDPAHHDKDVEMAVLNEMGDPARLAANYAGHPLTLIGPQVYLAWKRLTTLLLWIVLPIVAVLVPIGMWLGDDADTVFAYVGTTVGATLTVGVHLVFWVTLVFAVMERSGTSAEEWSEPWSVARLEESADVRVSGVETAVAVGALAVTAAFIIWQEVWPWATSSSGEGLPVINSDLWAFILPALLVVMAIEAIAAIARQVRGRWTVRDWWLTLALNVTTVSLLAVPVARHDFLNRDLAQELGWPDAATTVTLEQLEWLMLLVVLVTCIADVWGSWRRAQRSRLG